jgi:hypothetical protein
MDLCEQKRGTHVTQRVPVEAGQDELEVADLGASRRDGREVDVLGIKTLNNP